MKRATTSVAEAIASIEATIPGATVESIVTKEATVAEARQAKTKVGERIFVATVKHAEFPAGDGPDEDSAPEDSAPAEEPKEEKSEPKSEDSGEGEKKEEGGEKKPEPKGDGEGADDALGGPEGEPKKPSKDDLLLEVLQKLLMKLDGGDDPMAGPGGPDDAGIAEVGAPGAGEPMPPHAMKPHPSGGPAGHGAPLPPPVDKPMGGGAAFAHYNPSAAAFSVMRKDAGEIGNRGLIAETESVYPTHRVAKIVRTGLANVDGQLLDIAEAGIALLTLTKR